MGKLIPGATYVYENDGNDIYARVLGSSTRTWIGSYPNRHRLPDLQELQEIIQHADEDAGLRAELDRVLTYWRLIKE